MKTCTEVKEGLLYYSYVKAQKQISRYLKKPLPLWELEEFYPEYEYYIDEDDYLPPETFPSKILSALCDFLEKEEVDSEFKGLIDHIEYNMAERNFDTHIASVFYFRSLFENLHYFTYNEILTWMTKMEEVFQPFGQQFVCKQYSQFYEWNFKTQFFNGDAPGYMKYYEQMKFAYVLCYSYQDSDNEITPRFIQQFVEFVYRYMEFYKELTLELEQKRQVTLDDQTSGRSVERIA